MPTCYLLSACVGSSIDQETNNITLFNLVEQINVPPNSPPPPNGVIPLEAHGTNGRCGNLDGKYNLPIPVAYPYTATP